MQLSFDSQKTANAEEGLPPVQSRRTKRRAATSMEYCVMVSFILLVLIASIHALGFTVGGLFTSSAAATSKFSSSPKIGP